MAITRAQQAKQMLQDGGMLVKPSTDGKRPGYRRSKYDSSGGGLGGSKSKTGKPDSPGPSDRDDDPSPQDRGRGSIPTRTKKVSEAEKKAQRDKFKADRKTFVRNIKRI